jgi:TolA-binding protein
MLHSPAQNPRPVFPLFAVLLTTFLTLLCVSACEAQASIPNHLYRVEIRAQNGYTRINLHLAEPSPYVMSSIPGDRLRIAIQDTGGTLFKKFRRYSDANIGGLIFFQRGDNLLVTFQVSPRAGWRDITRNGTSTITVDVGASFKPPLPRPAFAGREKIWNGIEKLIRDFDPPIKSEIPFTPTDRQVLKKFLDENDQKAFLAAEGALYKGNLTEAEELLTQFGSRQSEVRPLALYRLAETWYKQQKYPQALALFREAEKLWPAYLGFNPGITFYYGDSIARSGDLASARSLLTALLARLADKKFAPALLVRLGDILTRQGHEQEALAIYKNVAENFSDNKASQIAAMRLADRDFLQTTPWNYRPLRDIYKDAARQSGDIDMREEAHFKNVLLEAMHGEAGEALQLVSGFQRAFPRGVYAAVARSMREALVSNVYQQTEWSKDPAALVRFIEEQHDYLADCIELPAFVKSIAQAYTAAARPIELVKMLTVLVERVWAAPVAPEMYSVIAENAELIGDTTAAEHAITTFLKKYPTHSGTRAMKERLGALYFSMNKPQQVKDSLLWLLSKGEQARQSESYYRLGRALWELQQYAPAIKAMNLFLNAGDRTGRLVADAYYVAASSRESVGDSRGALQLLEAGIRLPDNKRGEEFIYKTGQIYIRNGNIKKARVAFEQLVKTGKDSDWQQLARQALASLQ